MDQISTYFTIEMIYLWTNLGVIPIWISLIFFPNSNISRFFCLSIFPYFILSSLYLFLLYYFFTSSFNFYENFNLYLGLNELKELFSNEGFLIFFWIHFLSINIFCGAWIVNDSQKLMVSKYLVFFPLIITYFIGPVGIFFYWIVRIFYSKSIKIFN